jgi:predicted nucleotidyltransferase component of viral defense system
MLPANIITAWAADHPWPTRTQVEQDLLLSQAICAISNHSYLGDELAFRGGTALHKLHTAQPYRYSEDLDYVRSTAGGISDLTKALTEVGQVLGYKANTRVGEHPKVYWRTDAADGSPIRIKIEVNTYERSPALDHTRIPYQVNSAWWSGTANVKTFQPPELVATKIRALYQRSKGRDVFDLWIALTELNTDPDMIVTAFGPYRPAGWTPALAERNLQDNLSKASFTSDLVPLVQQVPEGFSIKSACQLILTELIHRVER